jgi:O-acetylhomoserine/O-acetylserine sulfhydrylase
VIIDSGKFPWEKSQGRFPQFFEPSPGFHGLKIWEKFSKLAFVAFARIAVMRDIGPCMNPMEASLLLAGVETLAVRVERMSNNALELAKFLDTFGEVGYLGMTPSDIQIGYE